MAGGGGGLRGFDEWCIGWEVVCHCSVVRDCVEGRGRWEQGACGDYLQLAV